jgi:mono/diheme cytochrome c family protein
MRHIITTIASMLAFTAAAFVIASCKTTPYAYSVNPYEYSGVRLYQVFCSSCHGLTGLGDGPVQPLFRSGVPDLAHLAARNHGQFPTERVRSAIDGRETFNAHGTSNMPVWGFEFADGRNERSVRRRSHEMIDRIVHYLEKIQVPDRPRTQWDGR